MKKPGVSMRTKMKLCLGLAACLLLPGLASAQQGHPLQGIWLGSWGPSEAERHDVVLELYWQNTSLSGNINPGFPDGAVIQTGELDSSNWTVHIEAAGNDAAGNPVTTVIEGTIEELGSPKRTLSGTWRQGDVTGDFQLTRE